MTDAKEETRPKPARPLNRWGMGTLSAIQIILLGVAVIALNYLAFHHYLRADLSRSEDYSLSPATRHYLASPAVREREKPVKWIMAFRRVSPFYERVRAVAEEYSRRSKGRIELEVVDPLRSPDRMQEINAAYGLTLVRDLMIIDARTDDSPVIREDANKVKSLHPNVKLVVAEDMAVYTAADGKRRITGFQGEDVLTARLVESIEGRPKKMALLADKSRLGDQEGDSPRRKLEEKLRFQNIELADLQLSGLDAIPAEYSGIVIAAPRYDLSDSEIAVLENYWNQPRAAILVLANPNGVPDKLRAFLRSNGITPRQDRVISRGEKGLVTRASGIFTKGVDFTRDLAGQVTEFGGATASIDVREGAEDLLKRRIYPMGLIEASKDSWGESKFGQGNETYDEKEDQKPPFFLAACAIRGAESDDRFATETSRLLVISNTDFLEPEHQRAENLDFLASGVNWLVGREALAGIGPRPLGVFMLPLLDAQVSFINRVNLFFLPGFLLVVGAFVWSSRRA
jgi:hypothetical protein